VGVSKPPIIRSVVVLPQPDGPSSEKNSPSRMLRDTPFTETTLPWPVPKRLTTFLNSTPGSLIYCSALWLRAVTPPPRSAHRRNSRTSLLARTAPAPVRSSVSPHAVAQATLVAAQTVNAFEVGVKGGVQIFPVVSVM